MRRLALVALVAGVQALAPASAAAVDDVNFGSGCQPGMGLPLGIGVNEANEICTYEVGGGTDRGPLGVGYGGGAATPEPSRKPGWIPELIRPEAKAPAYCIVWPRRCELASSGRPPQSVKRDHDTRTGGGGGEPARGKPTKGKTTAALSVEDKKTECRAISKTLNARLALEQMDYWRRIKEILDEQPDLKGSPVVVDAEEIDAKLKALIHQWNSKVLSCSGLLNEKLPAVYDGIK